MGYTDNMFQLQSSSRHRLHRGLLLATIILAIASVALTVITGRPSVTLKPGEVLIEGMLKSTTQNGFTITLNRRSGLTKYLPSPQTLDLPLATTASTTFTVIYTPEKSRLTGDGVSQNELFLTALLPEERLRVIAKETTPGSRSLVALEVTAIRLRRETTPLNTAPVPGTPTPGDLR